MPEPSTLLDMELVPFRFEITDERLAGADRRAMRRANDFVNRFMEVDGAYMDSTPDYPRNSTTVQGKAPQPVVTVLQAIAMGHDIGAVLDMLDPPDIGS